MADSIRVGAYINVDAFRHNLMQIKNKLPSDTLVMPVIKADAYGHGVEFAVKGTNELADYYAVAIIEEAVTLRECGVKKPIMILGHTAPCDFLKAIENDITVTVFSFDTAQKLSQSCKKAGKTAKVHIAVDTGMSRIGFKCTENSVEQIKKITELPNIITEGLFSHFASADEKEKDFAHTQLQRFDSFVKLLEAENIFIPIKHISNSAAIMDLPESIRTMARPGIILYGLYPSDEVKKEQLKLKPVMELISRVACVKEIEEGDCVGYGCTFRAEKKMKIATIPVGYADGYPRILSNKGRVIINNEYAPIIGRVCMDQFMVDVTHIESVNELDKVILIGQQGDKAVTAEEVASLAGTINYEVTCGISKRVPRIYKDVNSLEK